MTDIMDYLWIIYRMFDGSSALFCHGAEDTIFGDGGQLDFDADALASLLRDFVHMNVCPFLFQKVSKDQVNTC